MLGIEFSELMVCLLVALIVIGPQRLPEAVRSVALWVGRFKRSLHETKEAIEQQLGVEEIRRQLHTEEMMRTLEDMQEEIEVALNYERMGNRPALDQPAQPWSQENMIKDTQLATIPSEVATPARPTATPTQQQPST